MALSKKHIERQFIMSNVSITLSQRGSIYAYLQEGLSYGQIALRLHHSKSVIWNEVHRLTYYNPDKAQADEKKKRSHCGRHPILNGYTESIIYNDLKLKYPPEIIAHELHIAASSIYNWIYKHRITGVTLSLLPEHGLRRKRKRDRRGHFPIKRLINERPADVNNRSLFGNWEADTIMSPRGKAKPCLVTFIERKTRLLWSMIIPNRTHKSFAVAMKIFMSHFKPYVKSITTDHGREFSHNYIQAMVYHLRFYFCHPYSPWERGTNERMNRKLRGYFPKGTNFNNVSQDEVFDAVRQIDTRPMEALNYRTAIQAFRDEINKLPNRSKQS
ncbi:IS30 family transposase [Acetilactobacillus jinshanensis]|uniref:IS30 family transposase n=2 Tax=Acetilactobacillus jinshanensis TaxID=1720083 RepID=A0A4P6ZKW2_9LACO|nr:IS30 family transposase [Acetilactobacillus jinshanensis]